MGAPSATDLQKVVDEFLNGDRDEPHTDGKVSVKVDSRNVVVQAPAGVLDELNAHYSEERSSEVRGGTLYVTR